MTEEHQKLLRAMLDARLKFEDATEAHTRAWKAYLQAQADFTGKFASTDYPLGPFVVGTSLIEHDIRSEVWPPTEDVFSYRTVVRCPTSE